MPLSDNFKATVHKIAALGHDWWVKPSSGAIRSRSSNLDPISYYFAYLYEKPPVMEDFIKQGLAIGLSRQDSITLAMASDNLLYGADSIDLHTARRFLLHSLCHHPLGDPLAS